MSATDQMYAELKPDLSAISEQLFTLSETFLRKNGNFLPHGALLKSGGEVVLVAAAPDAESDLVTSVEVLPLLHRGLRAQGNESHVVAVGVAENVYISQEGHAPTKAIKVLVEHRKGLTVAFYLPFEKKLFRRYDFGPSFAKAAEPEVAPWA